MEFPPHRERTQKGETKNKYFKTVDKMIILYNIQISLLYVSTCIFYNVKIN